MDHRAELRRAAPALMSRRHLLAAALAALAALGGAACGDDGPEVARLSASHRLDAVTGGGGDAAGGDAIAPDATAPDDTRVPADTAAPTDTRVGTDAVADTAPGDTAPGDTPGDAITTGGHLSGPALLAIPAVTAGGGGTEASLTVSQDGASMLPVTVTLDGAGPLRLVSPPGSVPPGGTAVIRVAFDGSAIPGRFAATLRVAPAGGGEALDVDVVAVAVDPSIPAASWGTVTGAGGVVLGRQVVLPFPTAPYPDVSGSWRDPSVLLFVPEGFRDRGTTDFVVHFHGFGFVLTDVPGQYLREQVHASGVNAVLVVPQGPVDAASGDFGKLMDPGGLEALLDDVETVLYRDGFVARPVPGDVLLTEHSGGYQGVAENLDAVTEGGVTTHANLFDGLYARSSQFQAFVGVGGYLRSDHTPSGGTRSLNAALATALGAAAATTATFGNLRDARAVIWPVACGHLEAMYFESAMAEALRWGATRSRRGPRVELRTALASAGAATVRWLSPDDDDLEGFDVQIAEVGGTFSVAASVGPDAVEASFPLSHGVRVRVVPRVAGVALAEALPSDTYYVGGGSDVLVVDGFDRVLGGSFGGVQHDFAARVGAAIGARGSASNEAVAEGEAALGEMAALVWLLGDESTNDHTFTAAEQAVVNGYLDGGGGVVVSGSEVAWDLGAKGNGTSFLAGLGATYVADASGSLTVSGAGSLASIGALTYSGAAAPYQEDFPDVLGTANGAEIVLRYGNSKVAGVARLGRSAVVGFPLELVDDPTKLALLVSALVDAVTNP